MLKSSKIILITATALLVGGIGITGAAYAFSGFDPGIFVLRSKEAMTYERKTAEIGGDFRNIRVDCKTEDIRFLRSTDGKVSVQYSDCDKLKHNVAVEGDSLRITADDTRNWSFYFFNISINDSNPRVYQPLYVYLPDGKEYGDISVQFHTGDIVNETKLVSESFTVNTNTGDIKSGDLESGTVGITAKTGDITIENVKTKDLKAAISTGDIKVGKAEADTTDLSTHTGDVTINSADKGSLRIEISTGDAKLYDVEATTADISTHTGDIRLDGYKADDSRIRTGTGEINGSVIGDYQYKTSVNTGDIDVPDSAGEAKMDLSVRTGDIDISKR